MKKFLLILFSLPILLIGQESDDPSLWEVVNIKVKAGQEEAFEAAVKAHNEKFHGEGPHQAQLFFHINGPDGGKYQWVMGPTNWAALDSRPADDAHNDDWAKVLAMTEYSDSPQYWSTDLANSQLTGNAAKNKSTMWMYDLKRGKEAQWAKLVSTVKQVYAEKLPDEDFFVGWNELSNNEGEDAIIIFTMEKWAERDQQRYFPEIYESVHGKGSWFPFLTHVQDCFHSRVDWFRERID